MSDYIIRATAADSQIRAFAATTREIAETARKAHNTSPVATAALGRLLTAGAMMGAMMKGDKDLLTLQIRADGPLRGMTVTADAKGNVKGFAGNPQVMLPPNALGKLDVGGAVGHGILNVIKDMGMKEPYVGQVGLQTGEIAGAEAIVRYHHKDLGIMDPGRYINLLEETRLSHYLDLYVFEEVCKTLHRWELDNLPMIPVSVNFAGTTLRQDNLIEEMEKLIDRYRVRCEYLEVEVSESYADMNQEMLAETSSKIRKANVRVILDHFGSKNSSFSILSLMEFDGLKLDKSVISNLVGNRRSRLVAKAVIDICRQLGAVVMASGVETQDQVNVLEELGCDYAQGSFFNKAITIETFEVRYLKE